ncbi:MAG: polyprenyl synthetase family protein [Pseudomonadota bacterium]
MLSTLNKTFERELFAIGERMVAVTTAPSQMIAGLARKATTPPGKMIRSIVTLTCAEVIDVKGDAVTSLCAALELIHSASLLHDDIIDDEKIRRGNDSFRIRDGDKMSLLVGDFLWCGAIGEILAMNDISLLRSFQRAALDTISGEILELQMKQSGGMSPELYLQIIELKTASLFKLATRIPVLLSPAEPTLAEKLEKVGRTFGIAYQIRDDLNDHESDTATLPGPDFLLKELKKYSGLVEKAISSIPDFHFGGELLTLIAHG